MGAISPLRESALHELDGRSHRRRLPPVRVPGRPADAAPAGGRAKQLHDLVAGPSPLAGRPFTAVERAPGVSSLRPARASFISAAS
jgi:hypothetical protein